MSSRREQREAVVQLLYARELHGGRGSHEEGLWELIFAPRLRREDRNKVKLLIHGQQARRRLVEKLTAQSEDLVPLLTKLESKPLPEERLRPRLIELIAEETQDLERLELLQRLTQSDGAGWQRELKEWLVGRAQRVAQRRALIEIFAASTLPAVTAFTEVLRKLNELEVRARRLVNPAQHPDFAELKGLCEAQIARQDMRREVEEVADAIVEVQSELDARLDEAAPNFSLTRFARPERAILRQALWEMGPPRELPPGVAINEAVELAKRFSGSQAAGFVNGLLDALARSQSS